MTGLIILGIVVGIIIYYFISTQRSLVNLDELGNNTLSQISVQLNSRWDAISALVKMTEKYSKYEFDTLTKIIAERRRSTAITPTEINQQQESISQIFDRLMMIKEDYPELQAAEIYQKAMNSITQYEENVRVSRMVYNDSVTKINRLIRQWPSAFVANILHFQLREYLEENQEKKEYPSIQ